jgi:DNA ligase (NAD+)
MDEPNLFDAFQAETDKHKDNARVRELMRLIRHHRNLYYNDMPQISDDEFDAYVDELRDLDPNNEVLFETGAPVADDSPWVTGTHKIPMFSLDKVNTVAEMKAWTDKVLTDYYCVEEKLDGASLSADYVNGKLVRVLTRGHGDDGEDITRNAVKFKGMKQVLPTNFTGSLRCEAMLFVNDFDAYNAEAAKNGWKIFKNQRNGASGLARRANGDGVHHIRVLFYDIATDTMEFKSRFELMGYIRNRLGLWTPWFARVQYDGLVRVYDEYQSDKRVKLPYEIDGLVVKIDDLDHAKTVDDTLQKSLSSHNPKAQIAWKFEAETRVTTLESVTWEFGLGGRVTPVANLAPVKLCGVTVTRASLHNARMVLDLGLTVGCQVLVKRANDVIPQVVRALTRTDKSIEFDFTCPACSTKLSTSGEYIYCANKTCPGIIAGNVRKWITNLEIDHFGMSVIDPLVANGKLKSVADLYRLTEEDVADVSGRGIAKRALANLHAKKVVPTHIFFGSLNITAFGRSLAKMLVKAGYDTVDKMLAGTIGEFAKVDGFGTSRATDVWNGLRENETMIRELEKLVTVQGPKAASAPNGPLAGKSFCITGSLSQPKKVFEQMITDAGGLYETSVKKGLSYLIAESSDSNSDKAQKARKIGIPVIGEAELRAMLK